MSNVPTSKPYCLPIEAKEKKPPWLALKSDDVLYGWKDNIYQRSPLMSVSGPTTLMHKVHVGSDPISGAFKVRSMFTHTYAHTIETDC
jgi:hypothetical protein